MPELCCHHSYFLWFPFTDDLKSKLIVGTVCGPSFILRPMFDRCSSFAEFTKVYELRRSWKAVRNELLRYENSWDETVCASVRNSFTILFSYTYIEVQFPVAIVEGERSFKVHKLVFTPWSCIIFAPSSGWKSTRKVTLDHGWLPTRTTATLKICKKESDGKKLASQRRTWRRRRTTPAIRNMARELNHISGRNIPGCLDKTTSKQRQSGTSRTGSPIQASDCPL